MPLPFQLDARCLAPVVAVWLLCGLAASIASSASGVDAFNHVARDVLDADTIRKISQTVNRLETLDSAAALASLMKRGEQAH